MATGWATSVNDIFVSWALPDKAVVDRIINRLEDAGLPINEYSRKMPTGAKIRQWISQSIAQAKVMLALVSAETLRNHRDWINFEFSLAVARLDQPHNKLIFILVRLDTLPAGPLPGQLPDDIKFLDFDAQPEEELIRRLTLDLRAALGQQAPFVIPAAQYAMTSEEFAQLCGLVNEPHKMARLAALCQSVGMPPQPELWEELGKRYGQTEEDFAPYGDGRRLRDVAQQVLRDVNKQRLKQRTGRPLYLRWYSRDELTPPNSPARGRWKKGYSILIVDAVSALHGEIAQALEILPSSRDDSKRAVVCVPPYTRHTGVLEHLIAASLRTHARLSDVFQDWQQTELPWLAFDIPTETSLKQWFGQLLFTVDTGRQPFSDNVDAMAGGDVQDAPGFPYVPGGYA